MHEMKNLFIGTGGYVVQADSFKSALFVQSFKRIWTQDEKVNFLKTQFFFQKLIQGHLDMNFNATIEVKTSREVKVCGMIG